jgi:hypothetical protein
MVVAHLRAAKWLPDGGNKYGYKAKGQNALQ